MQTIRKQTITFIFPGMNGTYPSPTFSFPSPSISPPPPPHTQTHTHKHTQVLSTCLHVTSRWPYVGDQEHNHFSPLGTKQHFNVNYSRKIYCFDHQHCRLVKRLQTKNIPSRSTLIKNAVENTTVHREDYLHCDVNR